jgi:hypothetical protein
MAEFKVDDEIKPVEDRSNYQGKSIKNLKELTIGNGQVRIQGGAIIINDGYNDRVLIGFLEDGF